MFTVFWTQISVDKSRIYSEGSNITTCVLKWDIESMCMSRVNNTVCHFNCYQSQRKTFSLSVREISTKSQIGAVVCMYVSVSCEQTICIPHEWGTLRIFQKGRFVQINDTMPESWISRNNAKILWFLHGLDFPLNFFLSDGKISGIGRNSRDTEKNIMHNVIKKVVSPFVLLASSWVNSKTADLLWKYASFQL